MGKDVAKQLFTNVVEVPRWKKMGALKVNKQKFGAAYAKCLKSVKKTPFGRLAYRHTLLRRAVKRAASNCAVDNLAGVRGRKPKLNRRLVKRQICRVAAMSVRRANPNTVLCRVVRRCGRRS